MFMSQVKECLMALGSTQARCREITENEETYTRWRDSHIQLYPEHSALITEGPVIRPSQRTDLSITDVSADS